MNPVIILTHDVSFPIEKHRRIEFTKRMIYISKHFPKIILISTDSNLKNKQIQLEFEQKYGIYLYKIPKNEIISTIQCKRIIKNSHPALVICDTSSDARKAILSKIVHDFPMITHTLAFDTDMYLYSTRLKIFKNSKLSRLIKGFLHFFDVFNFNLSNRILCVSPALVKYINRFILPEDSLKQKFIPNSYYHTKHISQESSSLMQKKLDTIQETFDQNQYVILFVGDLIYNKRPDIAILSLKYLLNKIENVILLIIGNGPMDEILRRYSQKLKMNDRIFFLGRLEQFQTIAMISKSDAVIFPSISEGFSNVISEAMAVGTPVVAYAQKSISDLCKDKEVPLIYDENPQNYAAKLYKILKDSKYRDNIVKNLRDLIEPFVNNTPEKRYIKILQEYKDVIRSQYQVSSFKTVFKLVMKWITVFFSSLIKEE